MIVADAEPYTKGIAHRDVPGLTMCPTSLPATPHLPHIVIPGTPRRQRFGAFLPARWEAAARAISVVTILPSNHT